MPARQGDAAPALLVVAPSPEAVAREAANWLVAKLEELAATRAGRIHLGLAGGSTPRRLYRLLSGELATRVPWARLDLYFGDERCLPPGDSESNFTMVREALLGGVDGAAARVFPMFPASPISPASPNSPRPGDPAFAAQAYEALLPPALDILLLGLGPDGHTCSLFPGHASLDERARRVLAIDDSPKPPPARITVTPPVIEAAHALLMLAAGADKADAVEQALAAEGDLRQCPARLARRGTWIIDTAAAGKLGARPAPASPIIAHQAKETPTMERSQFAIIGLGVMGQNLALNVEEHGFPVAVWNYVPAPTDTFMAAHGDKRFVAARTLAELVAALDRPRRIMMMVTAGAPVDQVIAGLKPLLAPGDVVIDGGNSWFRDTERREAEFGASGIHFVGMGVSGGEEGARRGPSLMPGGTAESWSALRPILESIAAKTESGPCVTHVGPGGAGHFVKMVHNGIEYADMQLIAEAYDVLRRAAELAATELAAIFAQWNRGPMASFLVEITAEIFTVQDPETGRPLVDVVLDKAGQKGTGKWTAQVALDLGVPIPAIGAALDARILSSRKDERVAAARLLSGPPSARPLDGNLLAADVHQALLGAKICAYAQGMSLIRAASREYKWNIEMREMARIWKGGCIIRARLLDTIMRAFEKQPELDSLLLDEELGSIVDQGQAAFRRVVALGAERGIPLPALGASLSYYDSLRAASLPQNLTQAQRDAFGAHTYQRSDHPERGFVHSRWLTTSGD